MGKRKLEDEFSVVVVTTDMDKDKNQQKTVVLEDEREGKDEMNLVELPFALISDRNSKKISTIERRWAVQGKKGRTKNCYEIITGSNKQGLPTFQAERVTIAALALTFRKQAKDPKIYTTQYEMCSLLHWPYTSQYRKLLRNMFSLLKGITVETNHFYNAKTGKHEWAVFGIIDNAHFSPEEGYFKWNEDFWNALQLGHIKQLDIGIYFSLKRNLSMRLFRYADRHIYNGRGHEIDLKRLCLDKLLMMGDYQGTKHLIRELQPAIDEINGIEQDGCRMMRISIGKSKNTPSGHKVTFEKARKSRQIVAEVLDGISEQGTGETAPEAQISPSGGPSDTNTGLIDQLIARDISKTTARKLVREHCSSVVRHLEVFDFLMQKEGNAIEKPAGYLRRMIEEEWFLDKDPEGFTSRAEQDQRQRDREVVEKKLLAEYQQELEAALQNLEQLMQLPFKDQVTQQLESWKQFVIGYQKGKAPSEKMTAKREAELIKELEGRSREDRIGFKRAEIIQKYQTQAQKQGIGDINFRITEEV